MFVEHRSTDSRRRSLVRKHLKPNEIPLTLTSYPRLGVPGPFTEPYFDPADAVSSHSLFLPEEITNPHARFPLVPEHAIRIEGAHTRFFSQDADGKYQEQTWFQSGHQPAVIFRREYSATVYRHYNSMGKEYLSRGSGFVLPLRHSHVPHGASQRRRMGRHCPTISTWMQWDSGWGVPAYRSRSKLVT